MQLDDSIREALYAIADNMVICRKLDQVQTAKTLCGLLRAYDVQLAVLGAYDVPDAYQPGLGLDEYCAHINSISGPNGPGDFLEKKLWSMIDIESEKRGVDTKRPST